MEQIIRTEKGLVRGVREGSCMVFKNIPYAKPPVGERRFQRPAETDAWEGVLDCTEFGNITVQNLPGNEQPWERLYYKEFYSDPAYRRGISEDCLNLNIWAPAEGTGDPLPVAFWIHGGGFAGGYSSELEFGGEAFVRNGVILVTVEYRCGALGFMAHPWLSREDERGISGNYGIFDQIAALTWVYKNIAAFGGDPSNITVFGQSAGCMSTQVLISSELTGNMIAKAILQSGVQVNGRFLATPTLQEAEAYGEKIAEMAGIRTSEELRTISAEALLQAKEQFDQISRMEAMQNGEGAEGGMLIVPNVDGYLLKKDVGTAFRDGDIKKIPYMAGCVQDDLGTTMQDRENHVPGRILEECRTFCEGVREKAGTDGYCYLFARELPDENGSSAVAFHSAELWYMFGTLDRCWRPMEAHDYELSEEMVGAWCSFMKTGRPGDGWQPCTAETSFVKEFR